MWRVFRSTAGVNLWPWLLPFTWLQPNQTLITPTREDLHIQNHWPPTLKDLWQMAKLHIVTWLMHASTHIWVAWYHFCISFSLLLLNWWRKMSLMRIPRLCFSNAMCIFFLFFCHIHYNPLRIWKGMTWRKLLLDAAQFGDRRLDYASARHSNKKKRGKGGGRSWRKNEVCFWFQVAVKNVPHVLGVLALDLPAFNTQLDKNLFIWILSAKKLPRLA